MAALSTASMRSYWSPACYSKWNLLAAYNALDDWLQYYKYKVGPGSGAANCRRITGGSGYSLHAYFAKTGTFTFWNGFVLPKMALAVDINPSQNPYGYRLITNMPRAMVEAICRVRTNSGHQVWHWGGYFSGSKDAMHYQLACTPAQLATGINSRTLPSGTPAASPTSGVQHLMYRILWFQGEPSAAGDQPDLTAAYRTLMGRAEKNGKYIPIEAWWIKDPATLTKWRNIGLLEDPTRRSSLQARGTYNTVFHNGPFDND